MQPILFEIGSLKIYSFGLMMGIAFLVANWLFVREFRRKGLPEEVAAGVTMIALFAGVAGSKLFSLIENWNRFVADPWGEIFSAAGLTFYGGLILATLLIYLYSRRRGVRFLGVADAAAPSLMLAYGIGRIGCQLAGDGDYGIPTDLPWAMGYPNGTVSTLAGKNPELKEKFVELFPGSPALTDTTDILVHPAPVYETLAAVAIFAFLWRLGKRSMPTGMLFGAYLILAGLERLLVEMIRLNPLYLGLSQAQWISVAMIILGGFLLWRTRNAPFEPAPVVQTPRARGKQNRR